MADINTQTKQVLDKKEITNPTKIFSEENKAKEVVKEPLRRSGSNPFVA